MQVGFQRGNDHRHFAGFFLDRNNVAGLDHVRRNVYSFAVDQNVSVVDELTGGKDGRHELGFVNQVVQTGFQNADQVFGRIAASSDRFGIIFAQLFFGNVAVIGFQSLFGLQLFAVVGQFFLTRTVLTRTVFAFKKRALRIAPQVGVQAAVCFLSYTRSLKCGQLQDWKT